MKIIPDYYSILQVNSDATDAEIKKAFRKQSHKCHPDKHPEDPDAKGKFQELNNAYQVVGDAKKRKDYDQLRERIRKAEDQKKAAMEKEKAAQEKKIQEEEIKKRAVAAKQAEAAKAASIKKTPPVNYIKYDGKNVESIFTASIWDVFHSRKHFHKVKGKPLYIEIAAGVKNGQKLRYKGCGEPGRNGGKDGDLIIRCSIIDDPPFMMVESNLIAETKISSRVAESGGTMMLFLPDGPVTLSVMPGTKNGQTGTYKRKGFPVYRKEGEFGDLIMKFIVV